MSYPIQKKNSDKTNIKALKWMISNFCFGAINAKDCTSQNISNMTIIFSIYAKSSNNYLLQIIKNWASGSKSITWLPTIPFDTDDNPTTWKVCFKLDKNTRCWLEIWCCYCFDVIAIMSDWNKVFIDWWEICAESSSCIK